MHNNCNITLRKINHIDVKIHQVMKKNRQIKKCNRKPGRNVYGNEAHYWPEYMLPFTIAAACTKVVLDNSEKAGDIYHEAGDIARSRFEESGITCLVLH